MSTIALDEWEERYKPLTAPSGSEVWEYEEVVAREGANGPNAFQHVWTLVDSDTDIQFALPGWHIVNRFGYAVTKEPWVDADIDAIWTDDCGMCDVCEKAYFLASISDHCAIEGLCWHHCRDLIGHREKQEKEALGG
jgi:hypothetical protein